MNNKVTVMSKVSFLGWSRKASWRRCPLSRGLKKEQELTGDKEDEQPHEIGALPMSPCHSPVPLQSDGIAAGACLVSLVGASWDLLPDKLILECLPQGLLLTPPKKDPQESGGGRWLWAPSLGHP